MNQDLKVWWNGKIVSNSEVQLSLFTHALHYGTGVFEGVRSYAQTGKSGFGGIFRLKSHIERLADSLKILGVEMPISVEEWCQGAVQCCQANRLDECYIRPVSFLGENPLGVFPGKTPRVDSAILTWKWGAYLGKEGLEKGVRLRTSSFIRPHVNSVMTKGKITGQYVTGFLAKVEALKDGYDEGLLLDTEGYLAEGTGENLFIVKNGVVKTTPLSAVLSGITRETVMTLLKDLGVTVVEQKFTRDELWCADEIFLTGTAAEITPVASVDHREIGRGVTKGKRGALTEQVQSLYLSLVRGEKPQYRDWITEYSI